MTTPFGRKKRSLFSKEEQEIYDNASRGVRAQMTRKKRAEVGSRFKSKERKEEKIEKVVKEKTAVGFAGMFQNDQARIVALMEKHKIDPLEGLMIDLNNRTISTKDKIAIRKFLVPYMVSKKPELKALDVQQDIKMNVSVKIQSYRDASKEDFMVNVTQVDDSEYDEFTEEVDDEIESGETGN